MAYHKVGVDVFHGDAMLSDFFCESAGESSKESLGSRISGQHGRRDSSRERAYVQYESSLPVMARKKSILRQIVL